MSNKSTSLEGLVLGVLALAFLGGLGAFLYMKFRAPKLYDKGVFSLLLGEAAVALGVTLALVAGSFAGAFFWGTDMREFLNTILNYAITFFIEAYIAMIWICYIKAKQFRSEWRQTAVCWFGLFCIFIVFNLVVAFTVGNLISNLPQLILTIPDAFLSTFYGVLYMVQNPVEYIKGIFTMSGGNQFILVYEFPKWSLILLAVGLSGVAYDLATNNN